MFEPDDGFDRCLTLLLTLAGIGAVAIVVTAGFAIGWLFRLALPS